MDYAFQKGIAHRGLRKTIRLI